MYVLSLPEFAVRKQVDIDEKDITFINRKWFLIHMIKIRVYEGFGKRLLF